MNHILLNPFKRYDARKLLPIGLVATIAGSLLAYCFNIRFDGIADMHTSTSVGIWQPLLDNVINIATLFIFLALIGKYINNKTRLIDILTISVVSRIPLYLLPFLNIQNVMTDAANKLLKTVKAHQNLMHHPWPVALSIGFSIITIIVIIWYFLLLYKGYKIVVNAKGTSAIIFFIAAIIFAEILSKYLIFAI